MCPRDKRNDETIIRNYIRNWNHLIEEYELIKGKQHSGFKFVKDFYKHHGISQQTFSKFYYRYKQTNNVNDLLPQKRGPKYKTRRPGLVIETAILNERENGLSRYEIYEVLKPKFEDLTPSPSAIYRLLVRNGLNKLSVKAVETKRKIIKEKIGEMGHIDCHYLPIGIIENSKKRHYVISVVDDYSRVAWCDYLEDLSSLKVMFGIMRCFRELKIRYNLMFSEILTDNGAEFGKRNNKDSTKISHPVALLFNNTGIKHRFTKPYRPQTNGKVERFWRTFDSDMIEGVVYESLEDFKMELYKYMVYYNEHRPHQGIESKKPVDIINETKTCVFNNE